MKRVMLVLMMAFATGAAAQGLSPDAVVRNAAPPAKLAVQPMVLHTGNNITDVDRAQLRDAVMKAYVAKQSKANPTEAKAPAAKAGTTPRQATAWTISPTEPFATNNGWLINAVFVQPRVEDAYGKLLAFNPGYASYLTLQIDAKAWTTYVLTFHLSTNYASNNAASGAEFAIVPQSGPAAVISGTTAATFAGPLSASDDVAYALISETDGPTYITLYSPNAVWNFLSCDIEATSMQ
jgi:hypothetical protein